MLKKETWILLFLASSHSAEQVLLVKGDCCQCPDQGPPGLPGPTHRSYG
ncbi:MAG: hypothetical protein JSS61_05110 [Verrucomicrobia bacterium]|nr:hypothetical protein [Verrucomicrobiota bacterium]